MKKLKLKNSLKNKLPQDHQIQKVNQHKDLRRIVLILSCVIFFFSSYIANYNTTVDEAWIRWKLIIYACYVSIFFSLKDTVVHLITHTGYKIVFYLLLNYFLDEYLGYKTWSWNDFLTISIILLELVIYRYGTALKEKMIELKYLMLKFLVPVVLPSFIKYFLGKMRVYGLIRLKLRFLRHYWNNFKNKLR